MNKVDEYSKCRFCSWYNENEGRCEIMCCPNGINYKPDKNRFVKKAKEEGISVVDIIALIEMDA